ncbi:MAG: hypothetical protein R6X20_17960 [Phycisphaerae bacterium]
MSRRRKILLISVAVPGAILLLLVSAYLILSLDAPPPDDADLRVHVPRVPPEENAFPLLVEACDALYWPGTETWKTVHSPREEGIEPDTDTLGDGQRLENHMVIGEKWDADLAADVLDANRETLDLIEKALARPHFQAPRRKPNGQEFFAIMGFLRLADLLRVLSWAHAKAGEPQRAVDTALKMLRLAHGAEASGAGSTHYLVALTLRLQALGQLRQLAVTSALSAEGCRAAAAELASLPQTDEALQRALLTDYRFAAQTFPQMSDADSLPWRNMGFGGEHWTHNLLTDYRFQPNRTLRLYADATRFYIEQANRPPWEAWPAVQDWQADIEARFPDPSAWSSMLKRNSLGRELFRHEALSMAGFFAEVFKAETEHKATRLLLLLKAWKADHGSLPPSLPSLVPEYIDAVPLDPFDGKPIRYDPQKRILYSVGQDRRDDGGMSESEREAWWKREYPERAKAGEPPPIWFMPDPSFVIEF